MESLPEHFMLPVYYADVEGFSYKEIAEDTDSTPDAVRMKLTRAKTAAWDAKSLRSSRPSSRRHCVRWA